MYYRIKIGLYIYYELFPLLKLSLSKKILYIILKLKVQNNNVSQRLMLNEKLFD